VLSETELAIQAYLADRESEFGEFVLKVIRAKLENKKALARFRKGYGLFTMNAQEELFRQFFNHEKTVIKDMTPIELRAHIEDLEKIAYEARARLTAGKDEEQERKKAGKKTQGFQTSLEIDTVSSEAINAIKQRQGKMSKEDKVMAGLMKLGMTEQDARATMSAGAVLATLRNKSSKELNQKTTAELGSNGNSSEPVKAPINPFAKKTEPVPEQIVLEVEITIPEPTPEPKINRLNPFAK
jgi:hypothetical protein